MSNPFALRKAKTLWSFGRSECRSVNIQIIMALSVDHYN